jgi:Tfp pilus assembly protein PilN
VRIGINLASEPFRRDRPMLVASSAVAIVLGISLIALIWFALLDRGAVARDRQLQARLSRDLARLKADRTKYDREVRKSENAEVLDQSLLINALLMRKGISWTKMFADLEKTLPPNVRITQIVPQVNSLDQVTLDMTVAADSPEPLVVFIQKLEGSDVFGSASVPVSQAPSQTDPFYRYRLTVTYAQKL